MGDNGDAYYLKDINGTFLNFPIKGDVYFEKILKKINGDVEITNFAIPQEMFARLPLKTKFSNFNGEISIFSRYEFF